MRAVQRRKFVTLRTPVDTNGVAQGGNFPFVSLRHHSDVVVHFIFGAVGGDCNITLQQAKNVGGNGAKALGFDKVYTVQTDAGSLEDQDKAVPVAVVSDSHPVEADTDDNYHIMIEFKADQLDVNNGFDSIRPNLSDPAAATLVCIMVELLNPRYSGIEDDVRQFPSALDQT
jgi:hypothetical protein